MIRKVLTPFLTGLVFLAPVILTLGLLQWLGGYLVAALGPGTLIGSVLARGGMFFTADATFAFWAGVGLAAVFVWVIGLIVRTQARAKLEGGLDGLLGGIPVVGQIYRPLAQFVRMMGNSPGGEMSGMAVVSVSFGAGTEILALLASPQIYDFGKGPRQLVLIPTAPVPVGGAMMFVATDQVQRVPQLGVDDLAKFYVSMGTIAPAGLK